MRTRTKQRHNEIFIFMQQYFSLELSNLETCMIHVRNNYIKDIENIYENSIFQTLHMYYDEKKIRKILIFILQICFSGNLNRNIPFITLIIFKFSLIYIKSNYSYIYCICYSVFENKFNHISL